MRMQEIRALPHEELTKRLEDTYRELFNLRLRLATRQLANNQALRKAKKTIARMKTELRQRELAGGLGAGALG